MKTIWYIAKKDLLETMKDRSSILFMLAMPIIFITVMGLVLFNDFGSSGPIQVTVAISNQDNGAVSQAIISALTAKNSSIQFTLQRYSTAAQVQKAVADTRGNTDAGVVIPAGATQALFSAIDRHQPLHKLVQFYTLPGVNNAPAQIAQEIVNSVINTIATSAYAGSAALAQVHQVCRTPGNQCAAQTIDPQAIRQAVAHTLATMPASAPVLALSAGNAVKISSFDLYVPGYAIFFALFGINAVAGTILQEKEDGTLRRLLIAPIQKYALLGGKVLAQFVLTVLQMLLLFVFGYVFFHIHIGNILAVSLLILATAFGVTGLGIALVTLVKTRRQLSPVVTLVTLVSSIIGGVFFPAWLEPTWMQQVARIGLPFWAAEGMNSIMIYGKDLTSVLPDILGLLVYGLICYLIALRFFRFQEKVATA
ncbi:MAG TPA: ABC transporter permease [Ktedonobacteraceae bacterium]|jgi:ABC-2 type transport system permease protein